MKSAQIDEKSDSYTLHLVCGKYRPDPPKSPEPIKAVTNNTAIKPAKKPPPVIVTPVPAPQPPPPPTPPPVTEKVQPVVKPKPAPVPVKKESEEPAIYVEEQQVIFSLNLFLSSFYFIYDYI